MCGGGGGAGGEGYCFNFGCCSWGVLCGIFCLFALFLVCVCVCVCACVRAFVCVCVCVCVVFFVGGVEVRVFDSDNDLVPVCCLVCFRSGKAKG